MTLRKLLFIPLISLENVKIYAISKIGMQK